jgi:low temperature requirement protein LtrA
VTETARTPIGQDHLVETEHRVTPLELFFDLVFVFAITQVTGFMADDPTWEGLVRGLLILAALWWAWTAYAWLTSSLDPDEGAARIAMFAAMAAMFVVALAVPEAFGANAVIFGVAYLVVRVLHILLYGLATNDVDVRQAVKLLAPSAFAAPAIILTASATDGVPQGALWALALAVDYLGPLRGVDNWKFQPAHFVERHGLIVIIALGESIVAIGLGAAGVPLDAGILAAAVVGLVAAVALWWAYFDVVAIVAERKLVELSGGARNRMARDSYSYLHMPMVAGIILAALGAKKTLADVDDPLKLVPAAALFGGTALYFLAHVAFRLRNVRTWSYRRVVVALLCLALIPAATEVDALVALSGLTALTVGLIAYEAIRYRAARHHVRHGAAHAA